MLASCVFLTSTHQYSPAFWRNSFHCRSLRPAPSIKSKALLLLPCDLIMSLSVPLNLNPMCDCCTCKMHSVLYIYLFIYFCKFVHCKNLNECASDVSPFTSALVPTSSSDIMSFQFMYICLCCRGVDNIK